MARTKKTSDAEVLREAIQVIIRRGPESFTLADVSRKARLSPAALIKRFKTKEQLLVRALEQHNEDWANGHDPSAGRPGLPGLLDFFSRLSGSIQPDHVSEHLRLLANDLTHPKLNRLARGQMEFVRRTMAAYLRESAEFGSLSPADIEELTLHLEAVWHGAMIQWAFLRRESMKSWVHKRLTEALNHQRMRHASPGL